MLFSFCILSQESKTVPDISALPDRSPTLRRSTSADVRLGSDTTISVEAAPGRVYLVDRSHPMPTPLPTSMQFTDGGMTTTATRSTIATIPLSSILDEFPDSIAETISKELEKLIN